MNYGKESLSKKKKNVSSKKNMKKKRVGVRVFKAVVICFLLICIIGAVGGGLFVKKIIDDAPEITPASVKPSGYKSQVVAASNGQNLGQFREAGSNRVYKTIDTIPKYLANAFVAIEDERFYEHNGIDLQGILRAGLVGITSGDFSEGASTLTQQLIKNNVFPNFTNEKTFFDSLERKLQEQYLALEIEKQMTKEEILEAYMNTINLGQNCLGVQSAAKRYFNKDVSELTLSECAVIAGITQNPTRYDPVTHPEENAKRRDIVLNNMLEQGYITQQEFDEAKADPVYDRIQPTAVGSDAEKPNTYFIDELAEQILNDLQERKSYTATQAHNLLYSGGLTIYATQDPTIQQICDEEVADPSNYPSTIEYGLQYALTVTRADGSVENYSQNNVGDYIQAAWGREYPLVFSSPDEANQAVAEYKTTLNIQEGYCRRKYYNPSTASDFCCFDGSVYGRSQSHCRWPRGKNSQLFSEPCDRFLPAARFLFQTAGCLCSGDRYRKIYSGFSDRRLSVHIQRRNSGQQLGWQIYWTGYCPLCNPPLHERLCGTYSD